MKLDKHILNTQHYEGKLEAIKRLWIDYYKEKGKINPYLIDEKLGEKFDDLQQMKEDMEYKSCWYIVVSPRKDTPPMEFFELCKKALRKKWICDYTFWIEYGENGDHMHANFALSKTKYQLSRVRNEFFNTFKYTIGKSGIVDLWLVFTKFINIQNTSEDNYEKICDYQFHKHKFDQDSSLNAKNGFPDNITRKNRKIEYNILNKNISQ